MFVIVFAFCAPMNRKVARRIKRKLLVVIRYRVDVVNDVVKYSQ